MKRKALFNIFRCLSVAKNCLRPESAPSKILPSAIEDFELFVPNTMAVTKAVKLVSTIVFIVFNGYEIEYLITETTFQDTSRIFCSVLRTSNFPLLTL